jgi:DNA-binding SARP family transcriptional activator
MDSRYRMSVQFRLLGPVEIDNAGHLLRLTRRRERCLLAVLLLDPNQVVSVDRLAKLLWDGEPPERARRIIHSHISRLRSVLSCGDGAVIESIGDGYRICLDPRRVDVHRFRDLLAQAAATVEPANRIVRLRTALELWRGRPLDDTASDWLRDRLCTRLSEQHLAATEDLMTASLDLRRERQVLPELAQLASAHPGSEGLVGLHMRALYQASRKADALEVYDRARHHLADEYGLDPSPALRELHQAILRDEPTAPPVPAAAAGQPTRSAESPATVAGSTPAVREVPVPRQLPADVSSFFGRSAQLDRLDSLLDGDEPGTAVVISAIGGTAGVGKTALAVHWAHRVRDRFPDGQLYVNLRGYDSDQLTDPGEALTRFLSALGITGQDVPQDLDERAARYRSEIAGRRMLIVLDNAGSVEQVRQLLPGTSSNTVVVTSRDSLAGLVAVHGAHRLELDLLPPAEANTLLRRLIGPRVDAEPDAAATLADQCARLPLALRVAAELAAARPTVRLADLVLELADQRRRLDVLDGGDPYATVRTVFSWSIQHLPPYAAGTFRLLGLHPGSDVDPYAVAALAGTSLEDAHRRLEMLSRAHLLQSTGPGRYGMHDLLRVYAAELAHARDTEQVRHTAVSRLFDYYRYTVSVAMDTAYPYERDRRPRIPLAGTPTPDLSDPNEATGWLDIELPNLLTAARHAADRGRPEYTRDLSALLHRHLRIRSRYIDAETLHHQALTTARTVGDRAGELNALTSLGWVHLMQRRHEQALDHFGQALEAARAIGDRAGELDPLRGLGWVHRMQSRNEQALDHFGQALEAARAIGDRAGELDPLTCLGATHRLQGRYERALDHYQQALEIARATGHRSGELNALTELALLHRLQGRYERALDTYQQALEIARATGHRSGELNARTGLATIHRLQGRYEPALDHYQQVLDLAREAGDRNWQFEALHGLGRLHHTRGSSNTALAHHQQALELAADLGQPDDQARAHDGLGHAHRALNLPEQARLHWQQALDILIRLGTDHTEDRETNTTTIRAHLAALAER